jgi:hypothetical protein
VQWIKSDVPSEKWNLLILECHQDGSSSDMGEDKSSSLFFQGSIADAIVGAKTGQKILVVFVAGTDEESVNLECTTLQQSQVGFITCRPCCVLCIILILGLLEVSCCPFWGCVYLLLRSIHSPCIFIQSATTLKSLSTLKSLPSNCSLLCGC